MQEMNLTITQEDRHKKKPRNLLTNTKQNIYKKLLQKKAAEIFHKLRGRSLPLKVLYLRR